jgi:hypothetical protein
MPTDEAFLLVKQGKAILGGCVVTEWCNDWNCWNCNHEWFDPDDPAKQEIEQFLAEIDRQTRAEAAHHYPSKLEEQ